MHRRGEEFVFSDLIMSIRWVILCWVFFFFLSTYDEILFHLSIDLLGFVSPFPSLISLSWLSSLFLTRVSRFWLFWRMVFPWFILIDWMRFLIFWDVDLCGEFFLPPSKWKLKIDSEKQTFQSFISPKKKNHWTRTALELHSQKLLALLVSLVNSRAG